MTRSPITPSERDRIEQLLRTVPIFEAQRVSRKPMGTLFKIARAIAA
jgi:hypothetical protein